ncbi:MAG: L-histidine N(alpha)-methyltransferase [Gammaproteobacteria bacterium]|nr:L-histidine N(alpha)-methyltransferase [Gammaproteobacteria bacterium]
MNDSLLQHYQFFDQHPEISDFRADVIQGLSDPNPYILPKYFYDEAGSRLFEKICNTEEYYPTRTEVGIIRDNIDDIVEVLGQDCLLIEPGSGDSYKVRLLLDALRPVAYLPIDISKRYLQDVAQKLAAEFTWLNVHAICADFSGGNFSAQKMPYHVKATNKAAFFPGSTIGNFLPGQAVTVLKEIGSMVGEGGGLLIGVDLRKEAGILNAAYNDSEGYTRRFNKNLLSRINRELNADFELSQFQHKAFFNEVDSRIEMHLVSTRQQQVRIDEQVFSFAEDQSILTEYSHKYTEESFLRLAEKAGFKGIKTWVDKDRLFSVHYLTVTRC